MTRAAIVAATASSALIVAGGAAQAASSPHWQVSYRTHSATAAPLQSVTAPSKNDAWAVGVSGSGASAGPLVLHWNGSAWSKQAMPAGFLPWAVQSSSPDNVWIFGSDDGSSEAMVWDGSLWNTVALPLDLGLTVVLSASDVWGTTGSSCTGGNDATCTTTVWHWNGATWSSDDVGVLAQDFEGTGSNAWLLGLTSIRDFNSGDATGRLTIYRATSSGGLQRFTAPDHRASEFSAIAASPAGRLWVIAPPASRKGSQSFYHWTGSRWTEAAVPAHASGSSALFMVADALTYDRHGGVWAGPYAHWTGTKWINTYQVGSMPGSDGFALIGIATIPGSSSIWGAGWVGRSPSNQTQDSLIGSYGGTP
jgi:hypothetical protein